MNRIEVTTQAQLDKALKDKKPNDIIVCLGGTWDKPLVLRDSSHAELWGSSHAVLWGSSHAELQGSSHAELRDSSHAVLRDSSHAELQGSSHAELQGLSHAELWDSSHAELQGLSHAVLWDSSHAVLWDSSHAELSKFAAVHKMPRHKGTIKGGTVIQVPDTSSFSGAEWCDYYGIQVIRDAAILFKAVDDDYSTGEARNAGLVYTPSMRVKAPDWEPTKKCGNGLHVSPSPSAARYYNASATRYVAVKCKVADLVVIDDKAKVPSLTVAYECDIDGNKVAK